MFSINLIKDVSNLKDNNEIDHWYQRYVKLIEYAKQNVSEKIYIHKHHILPRSLFPEYTKLQSNIVNLSYRLHFIAHYILWKMTDTIQMALAFHFMATHTIKNSRLYSIAIKELYDQRKGLVSATNIITGQNELTKVDNLGITHVHTTVGKKWWTNDDGDQHFTSDDLSTEGYKNTHNFDCAPSKVYWTIDENGNRCRTDDESKKIKGTAAWQNGFNKVNKECTKFINLKTKNTVYINKNDHVPEFHYASNGFNKNTIVYLYNNTYYFGWNTLPKAIFLDRKILPSELDKIIIQNTHSLSYKNGNTSKEKKLLMEMHAGLSYYEIGVRAYFLYDSLFMFDINNSFNKYDIKCTHPK